MTTLSRLEVPRTTALRNGCIDGYAWHRLIWTAFPGKPDAGRDFLFRVDAQERNFRLLLLSRAAPAPILGLQWQTRTVAPEFLGHDVYRFQIKANPTMRRSADKRRLGIYAESRLADWMRRKASENGFHVVEGSLAVGGPVTETFVRHGVRGRHVAVDFGGVLEVSDRERFRHAFAHGIGAAKAFGYGLLMLRPLS